MKLSVIIPSKNIDNLIPCVAAVRKHEPDAEIIVVDDGLPTVAYAHPELDEARFVDGEKPFIYARNINIGIREAFRHPATIITTHSSGPQWLPGDNPDGVVLLNDDALIESPGGFTLMAAAARQHPDYGVIGATSRVTGNRNQKPQGRGFRHEERMVCFYCVYIPASTVQKVGLLDERYTGYGMDDDDYCWETRRQGLKIGIHDGCYVDHGSLRSSFRGDPKTPADFHPNLKLFVRKWGHDNFGVPAFIDHAGTLRHR